MDKESAQLCIGYELRAQVTPVHESDWMDKACTKSTFFGSRPLFITKP